MSRDVNPRFARVLSCFDGLRDAGTPNKWYAKCPAHDDDRPSLTIAVGDSGALVISCKSSSRCSAQDILGAVGLKFADLYPDPPRSTGRRDFGDAPSVLVDTFTYEYEDGEYAYDVMRYEPKDFSQRRPNPAWVPGGSEPRYLHTMAGVRMVPFHLPQLLAADPTKWVLLVEGERKVEVIEKLGMVATCHAMGSEHWKDEYADHFAGRKVAIFYDLDPYNEKLKKRPGLAWALTAARSLDGVAGCVRVCRVPDTPDDQKLDIKDWIQSTASKLTPAEQKKRLWDVVRDTPDYYPGWEAAAPFERVAENARRRMPPGSNMNDVIRRVQARLDAAVSGVVLDSLIEDLADAAAHCRWLAEALDPRLRVQHPLLGPTPVVVSTQIIEPAAPPTPEAAREAKKSPAPQDAARPQDADEGEAEMVPE